MLRLEAKKFWLSPGDGDMLLWVSGVAINSGMDVYIGEPDVSPLQIQGPKSPEVAAELFGDWALELKYYWLKETSLDGIPLVVARTGWSGELGYELFLRDSRYGEQLWQRVMEAGSAYDIAPIAPSTIRSIEGGLLSYASDITRADNPFVLDMDHLVDLDQPGAFIGREALAKIKADGVKRRLVGVEIHGAPLEESNREPWQVVEDDKDIGHITRCAFSPRLTKNIGFANIPAGHATVGAPLALTTPFGELRANVCETPWFPAQKRIPKGA
jgi:aminomethyltransferase